ncbi:E3 SUMO-protein ligase NSE2-like isoform X1 [Bactrocera tryoni]|uniref:E3 SUMO-protein ligase NSE2-like isoform X1 n=1 Tax=Bactrocera tryoni TaxID=59916 RepID=UPI001A969769|nr:E3 SUMO-protein ligase NSE2-like isoform X1 [Bactrocera tryoni]
MSDFLQSELEKAQQCLLETYELAESYGDNEEKDRSKYLQLMEQICQITEDAIRNEDALKVAMEERTIADFESAFQRTINRAGKKFQAKKTREYKAFSDRLEDISRSARGDTLQSTTKKDGALIEMDMQVNINDPITKKRMVDPVKNTICGHIYERSSIQDAIQIKPTLRCPVAGCGNNQYINMAHLKPDNALKLHLQRIAEGENHNDSDTDA